MIESFGVVIGSFGVVIVLHRVKIYPQATAFASGQGRGVSLI